MTTTLDRLMVDDDTSIRVRARIALIEVECTQQTGAVSHAPIIERLFSDEQWCSVTKALRAGEHVDNYVEGVLAALRWVVALEPPVSGVDDVDGKEGA